MQNIDIKKQIFIKSLDKLHAFVAVARLGSVSKAATMLNLSQSALSHLLTNFESSLDIKLLDRHSRGIRLTPKGQKLYQFSTRLIEESDLFCTSFLDDSKKPAIILRGGTHETLAAHIWPHYFKFLQKEEPSLKISLTTGRIDSLIASLLAKDLDFIVSVEPKKNKYLHCTKLYSGHMQFFVSPKWFKKNSISASDINFKDIKNFSVFTDIGAHTRQGMSLPQLLSRIGFTNINQYEVSSFEAAANLAASDLGIAVLPDRNAKAAIERKALVRLNIRGMSELAALNYKIFLVYLLKTPQKEEINRLGKALLSIS